MVLVADPATEARNRADRIREGLAGLAPDILAAWQAEDWKTLGYSSWSDYVVGEFGGPLRLGRSERKQIVAQMSEAGMSTRAIGTTLGVTHPTVIEDLRSDVGRNLPPTEEEPIARAWDQLREAMSAVESLPDARECAATVPNRRRAATARRLRRLGVDLGRIAWQLEGMEDHDDRQSDH